MKTDPEFTVCIFHKDINLSVFFFFFFFFFCFCFFFFFCFFVCFLFLFFLFCFFFFFFFGSVWFDGQVNTIKVLSRWSVFLTTLFLVQA